MLELKRSTDHGLVECPNPPRRSRHLSGPVRPNIGSVPESGLQKVTTHPATSSSSPLQPRRLLKAASERISDRGRTRLRGLLNAGDPHGEVRTAWHAKETVRGIYDIDSIAVAFRYTLQLADDLQDESCPPEINKLGRTIARWTPQITNWHISKVTNGPTEALNNLIKRIKRTAFGFRNFSNYRIRALLYAGKPNWDLLASVTPH